MFGQLLTWMQESKSSKYIVATANDMAPLLAVSQGALLRRFDDIFFVDLPNSEERVEILKIHNAKYKANIPESWAGRLENYTGAEIEKICKSSLYEGPEKAFSLTKTIYMQNRGAIDKMRNWARANARHASTEMAEVTNVARKLNTSAKKPTRRPKLVNKRKKKEGKN